MANPNEYIVFEPDQVLTNSHLNELFNYLDQQERWTRNKLLGIGIACGLDLVQHPGVIEITKGCGVTSEGYLILQDDAQYAYYMPYTPVDQPNDLPFTYPGNLPFYKPFCQQIAPVYLLLTDDQYDALDATQKAAAVLLTGLTSLSDWLVVLFLEVTEKDLQNCDTNDCNNKGEKMVFTVRPLLVNAKAFYAGSKTSPTGGTSGKAPEIRLKRYNVPYQDLQNATEVLEGFLRIVDDTTLAEVEGAYNYCYQRYPGLLPAPTAPLPFPTPYHFLKDLRDKITSTIPLMLEYFYDFVNDLILAYYEFREVAPAVTAACCADESLFPLHLVLGEADHNTSGSGGDAYRQYFIYSGLFDRQNSVSGKLALLFKRMQVMAATFAIPETTKTIRITPGQYEAFPLSQRAIPYYYTEKKDDPGSLYQYWSYEKTAAGNAAFNLSYNANIYNADITIVRPLLYDIERFHFFRIEGHIGQLYTTALTNLLAQRKEYNLPFDVVAVSADLLRAGTTKLPACNIRDLVTDYRLLLGAFACKVHTVFCFFSKMPYTELTDNLTAEKLVVYLQTYDAFKLAASLEAPITLVFGNASYAKGDFMRQFCPPAAGVDTIGSEYLADLANNGNYSVPSQLRLIFNFIDATESLMQFLLSRELSAFNNADFTSAWKVYERGILEIYDYAGEIFTAAKQSLTNDLMTDSKALFFSCLGEELLLLYTEYERRLKWYIDQLNFLHYFRQHPGLEHKAGVPKGGTFVLVYHETEERSVNTPGAVDVLNESVAAGDVAVPGKAGMIRASAAGAATLSLQDYEVLRDFVTQCKDAPSDQQQKAIAVLTTYQPPIAATGYKIANGVVIADFYVPYLCCSDCAPVAYILPTAPQDTVTFSIQPTFLFDDAHNYPFTANPPVSTLNKVQNPFTSDQLVASPDTLKLWVDEKNILYLHPAMSDLEQTLQATVTYMGITVPITIIKPDATFTMTVSTDPTGAHQLKVAAANTDAYDYHWMLNGQTSFDKTATPGMTEPVKGGDQVSLTITYMENGAISTDTKTQTVNITTIP